MICSRNKSNEGEQIMSEERKIEELLKEGWTRVGSEWHIRPLHRESLDYPGTWIDDYDGKGPHDWLLPPGCVSSCRRSHDKDCKSKNPDFYPIALCECQSTGSLYFTTTNAG